MSDATRKIINVDCTNEEQSSEDLYREIVKQIDLLYLSLDNTLLKRNEVFKNLIGIFTNQECSNKLANTIDTTITNTVEGTNYLTYLDMLNNYVETLSDSVEDIKVNTEDEISNLMEKINTKTANRDALQKIAKSESPQTNINDEIERNKKEVTDLKEKMKSLQQNIETLKSTNTLLSDIEITTKSKVNEQTIIDNLPELKKKFKYKLEEDEKELDFKILCEDSGITLSIERVTAQKINDTLGIELNEFLLGVKKCLKIAISSKQVNHIKSTTGDKATLVKLFDKEVYKSTKDRKKLLLLPFDGRNEFNDSDDSNNLLVINDTNLNEKTEFTLYKHRNSGNPDISNNKSSNNIFEFGTNILVTSETTSETTSEESLNKNIILVYIENDGFYMFGNDLSYKLEVAEQIDLMTSKSQSHSITLKDKESQLREFNKIKLKRLLNQRIISELIRERENTMKINDEKMEEIRTKYEQELKIKIEQSKVNRQSRFLVQKEQDNELEAKRLERIEEATKTINQTNQVKFKQELVRIEEEYKKTLAQISTNKQKQEDLILEGDLLEKKQISIINLNADILQTEMEVQEKVKTLQTEQEEESDATLKQQQTQSEQTIKQIEDSNAAVAQQKEEYNTLKQALIASTKKIEENTKQMTELYNDVSINADDLKQNIESLLSDIKAGKAEYDAALRNLQTHIDAQTKELGSKSGLEKAKERASSTQSATATVTAGGARKGKSRKHLRKKSKKTKKRKASSKKTKRKKSKSTTKKRKKTKRKKIK